MSTCKCGTASLERAECAGLILALAKRIAAGDDAITLQMRAVCTAQLVLGQCVACVFPNGDSQRSPEDQ